MATESSQQLLENRLFSHFRGWTWSERGRDTSSWLWDEGYDIQKDSIRRWPQAYKMREPTYGNAIV
ncbi:Ribonuclease H-like protein [Apiospora arundinis]